MYKKHDYIRTLATRNFKKGVFLPANNLRIDEGGLRKKGVFKKSYINKPLVTIITVTYNSEEYLEETIKCIINQTYDNIEYIVIDGNSTDSTINIIKKYTDSIDYWVSEPDRGMYEALNKGLSIVSGELINFCNSDDLFFSTNTINDLVKQYNNHKFDCCYGNGAFIDNLGTINSRQATLSYRKRYLLTLGLFFIQPTFFWTKKVMDDVGFFNLEYKIVSDRDFITRILLASNNIVRINQYLVKFRVLKTSFGNNNSALSTDETNIITGLLKERLNCRGYKFYFMSYYDRFIQKMYRIYMAI